MNYYEFIAKDYDIKSKVLSMTIVDEDLTFNSKHSAVSFWTNRLDIFAPIKIKANEYQEGCLEEDLVNAGNPQIVSEEFKRLVEELDSNAAQFFETEIVNCKTNKKYYVMHVIQTVNCMDRKNSKIINLPTKNIIAIGKIDSSKVEKDCHLFRLGEDVLKHYVSEKFYKEFKKRKLSGCIFNFRS